MSMELDRRTFVGLTSAALISLLTGCTSPATSSTSTTGDKTAGSSSAAATSTSATSTSSASSASTAAVTATPPSQMSLDDLIAQTEGKFAQYSYDDPDTGQTIEYNLCMPDGYDSSKSYPLITFIMDSSGVGQGTEFSLTQGYGGLVWASDYDQAIHPSFVLVPVYDSIIIDDNNGETKSDLIEATARLIDSVAASYSVDVSQLYATGQSMGCMTMLYLAANHPDLFAAEMFVDGQWDIAELAGLSTQTFCYFAAGGDDKASEGQANVEQMLDGDGVTYATATIDATAGDEQIESDAQTMLDEGLPCNFVSWVAGTVTTANSGKNGEHMASFDPAYKVDAVRTWLFEQK